MTTEEIDVLKLYAGLIKGFENNHAWNVWLTNCLDNNKLNVLISVRRGIQIGMATAQRKGLVTDSLSITFCRWTHSIDLTIKKLIKKREGKQTKKDKKQMDNDVEKYLRGISY